MAFIPRALSLSLFASSVACSSPENVAVGYSNLIAGTVYRATLVRVTPIYTESFFSPVYERMAREAGALVANRLSRNSDQNFGLTSLGAEIAGTLTAQVEKGNASEACQYFIQTDNEELIRAINPNRSYNSSEGNAFSDPTVLLEGLELSLNNLNSMIESGDLDPENEVFSEEGQKYALQELLDAQSQTLELLRNSAPQQEDLPENAYAVINPCRDFEVGDEILVVSYGYSYVLEKAP